MEVHRIEVTSIASDSVVLFDGLKLTTHDGLKPNTVYEFGQLGARTLPDLGACVATVATVNDVHYGEVECGVIAGTDIGPTFSSESGDEPYPEMMNRAAIAEISALKPDAVLVKGDLTSSGSLDEYQTFLDAYGGAFGDRLIHVRGNHDAYNGTVFADFATQEVIVEGATMAMLDTARVAQTNGSLSLEQIDWLDELAARTDGPVLVFGHHHIWDANLDARHSDYFGIRPDDSEALSEVFARRRNVVGYFSGHTHRNRRIRPEATGYVSCVEVASVKDFPGAVAEYQICEGGVQQIFRRISEPEALRWSEKTRQMYEGGYGAYSFGRVDERCFSLPYDRAANTRI